MEVASGASFSDPLVLFVPFVVKVGHDFAGFPTVLCGASGASVDFLDPNF
jgi:hypothetical protein